MKGFGCLLLAFLSLQLYGFQIDTQKCRYVETPEIIPVECEEKCTSNLCQGKVVCDLGAGPIIFSVSCMIPKKGTGCPGPDICARTTSAKFSSPTIINGVRTRNGGGSNAHRN